MDASQPTCLLAHWVRDRGVLSVEEGVRRLTSDTAEFIGYRDRGVVRAGAFADLNVIDLDAARHAGARDRARLPRGCPPLRAARHGFEHTIVNGEPFMEHGEHTGALAGGSCAAPTDPGRSPSPTGSCLTLNSLSRASGTRPRCWSHRISTAPVRRIEEVPDG